MVDESGEDATEMIVANKNENPCSDVAVAAASEVTSSTVSGRPANACQTIGVPNAERANRSPTIETAGESFADGTCIELIADPESGQLRLLFKNGPICNIAPRIEYGGRSYVPINLNADTLRAVRMPDGVCDHVSTTDLFLAIREIALERGFSDEVALVGSR